MQTFYAVSEFLVFRRLGQFASYREAIQANDDSGQNTLFVMNRKEVMAVFDQLKQTLDLPEAS
jgi:hypothetical protein